jgi:hypothetical protein
MAAIDPSHSHGKPEGLDKVILDAATSPVDMATGIGLSPAGYKEYIKE